MNNNELYENIMKNISVAVKQAINEKINIFGKKDDPNYTLFTATVKDIIEEFDENINNVFFHPIFRDDTNSYNFNTERRNLRIGVNVIPATDKKAVNSMIKNAIQYSDTIEILFKETGQLVSSDVFVKYDYNSFTFDWQYGI